MLIVKIQWYCVHNRVPLILVLSYIPHPSHAPCWWHKLQWNFRVIVPFFPPSGALLDGTRHGGRQHCSAVCATGSLSFHHTMYSITWTWCFVFIQIISYIKPIPVALCSMALVCSRSCTEIVDSSPTKGISVCRECCQKSLQQAHHSSRGTYHMWCIVSDLETSRLELLPALGCNTPCKKGRGSKTGVLVSKSLNFWCVQPTGLHMLLGLGKLQ